MNACNRKLIGPFLSINEVVDEYEKTVEQLKREVAEVRKLLAEEQTKRTLAEEKNSQLEDKLQRKAICSAFAEPAGKEMEDCEDMEEGQAEWWSKFRFRDQNHQGSLETDFMCVKKQLAVEPAGKEGATCHSPEDYKRRRLKAKLATPLKSQGEACRSREDPPPSLIIFDGALARDPRREKQECVHFGSTCTSRRPQVGDRVKRLDGKADEHGDFKLPAGMAACVVDVSYGDFKLCNPQGVTSGWLFTNNWKYVHPPGAGFHCVQDMPAAGDKVRHAKGMRYTQVNGWELRPDAIATVTRVDSDGCFKMRNPEGSESPEWNSRKLFVYCGREDACKPWARSSPNAGWNDTHRSESAPLRRPHSATPLLRETSAEKRSSLPCARRLGSAVIESQEETEQIAW